MDFKAFTFYLILAEPEICQVLFLLKHFPVCSMPFFFPRIVWKESHGFLLVGMKILWIYFTALFWGKICIKVIFLFFISVMQARN